MLRIRRQFAALMIASLAASIPLAAQTTRVIGYMQDGKTPINATIAAGYKGTGGTLAIGSGKADVVIQMNDAARAALQFPPTGSPYKEHAESWTVWRWVQFHTPDSIVDAPAGLAAASQPREMAARRARTPRELATQLATVFGHDFNQLTYLPGMALIAQQRLGNAADVAKLAAKYLEPPQDTLSRASSLTLAGHMVFAELARRTGDAKYASLVKKVGDLGFDASGAMQESMPFHGEMSDSYFMAGPITAMAGSLTSDRKYYAMAAKHFRYMDTLVLRPDGLFRHSPLTDAAWGRGNAFPALGMALTLTEFPPDHPDRAYVLAGYQRLMRTLAKFQDPDGMWHEIIDEPGSYAETSATAMIATAVLRGVRKGWIAAAEFQPLVDRAWSAILLRTAPDGTLIDVCESTNKQNTRDDYLRRTAITGKDERGGGMVLYFATEMLGLN